jgi:Uma2 family endonuclease
MLRDMIDLTTLKPGDLRPLRRVEYDRMIDLGLIDEDEKIELIGGLLVFREPHGACHFSLLSNLGDELKDRLVGRAKVRVQGPLAASEHSEPEPDIAVVAPGDYRSSHPTRAHLVIEVCTSSRHRDLVIKVRLYALAVVTEYWVIDTERKVTQVFRDSYLGEWKRMSAVSWTEVIAPVDFPDVQLRVADFA